MDRNTQHLFPLLVLACISLVVGGFIYILFRSTDLLMFNMFNSMGLDMLILESRQYVADFELSSFWIYSLPDGLWLYSLLLLLYVIWRDQNSVGTLVMSFMVIATVIMTEVLQHFNILNGTGDLFDVLAYCFFSLLYYLTVYIDEN